MVDDASSINLYFKDLNLNLTNTDLSIAMKFEGFIAVYCYH